MRPLRNALFLATALVAVPLALTPVAPASAQVSIGVNISIAPPALPVYEQPPLPAEGYLWTPGFWAYGPEGYYWVPGTWVQPPQPGLLWTPGYWGFNNGVYSFNAGYWGPHVGFYGGINYGFGYNGLGFFGGEWRGGVFAYNRAAVASFGGVHVTNVYNRTIVVNRVTNVSFNGGPHGIDVRPTPEQLQFAHEQHVARTALQEEHIRAAAENRELLASANHGHPPIAATQRPNEFKGPGVVAARNAEVHPAAGTARPGERPAETERRDVGARPGAEAARPGADRTRQGEETRRGEEAARPGAGATRHDTEAERRDTEAGRRAAEARPEDSATHKPDAARAGAEATHHSTEAARRPTETRPEADTVHRADTARPAAEAEHHATEAERRPTEPRPEAAAPRERAEVRRPEAVARPPEPHAAAPHPVARPAPAHHEDDHPKR